MYLGQALCFWQLTLYTSDAKLIKFKDSLVFKGLTEPMATSVSPFLNLNFAEFGELPALCNFSSRNQKMCSVSSNLHLSTCYSAEYAPFSSFDLRFQMGQLTVYHRCID